MRPMCAVMLVWVAVGCGPPPRGPPYPDQRATEPARSAASLEGEVLGVDRVAPADHLASGVRLRVQPGAGQPVVVDLAPNWYLERRDLRFSRAERVKVVGWRGPGLVFYATRISKGGRTIELRDPRTGEPLWRGPTR